MKVYLDSNVFIYAMEGTLVVAEAARLLLECLSRQPSSAVTSELTIAEVLVRTDSRTRDEYLSLFSGQSVCRLIPVSSAILISSAEYRRSFVNETKDPIPRIPKLPDAIHIVTALQELCTHVVSADARLRLPDSLKPCAFEPNSVAALVEALSS